MAYIPAGSLVFTGFGDAGEMRFYSPAGVKYAQPASNPNPGSGTDGIVVLRAVPHCLGIIGGNTPNFGTTGVGIFNPDGTVRAQGSASPAGFVGRGAATDGNDYLYGFNAGGQIVRWDKDGTQQGNTTVVLGSMAYLQALAMNPAGTIAYVAYAILGDSAPGYPHTVQKWNFAGSDGGLFVAKTVNVYSLTNSANTIACLSDGTVIIAWHDQTGGHNGIIELYNDAGTLLRTITPASPCDPIAVCQGVDATSFWVIYYSSASTFSGVTVSEYKVSDGSLLHTFDPDDSSSFEFDSALAVLLEGIGTPPSPPPAPTFETYVFAKDVPLRDPSTYFGGPKQPRALDMGTITRISSDWFTGAWQAQNATVKLADTDHFMRGDLGATANPGWSGGEYWAYHINDAQRRALASPRLIYHGIIRDDPLTERLTWTANANDIISAGYKMFGAQDPLPRKRIVFPANLPELTGANHLGVPWIFGQMSDEGKPKANGKVKLINVGPMVLNGKTYPAVGLLCMGACDLVISAYQNGAKITSWGTDIWAPGQTGWTTIVPSNAKYVSEVDGCWYTLLPMSGTRATDFIAGKTVTVNVRGLTYNSDGTGGLITNLLDQYRFLLVQGIIGFWVSGPWLPSPLFEFFPGGPSVPIVNEQSFSDAHTVSKTYISGGFQGGFVIGADGRRTTPRQAIADFNICCGNLWMFLNAKQQLSVRMLDRNRARFLGTRPVIHWRRNQLTNPSRDTQRKRDWLFNILDGSYNYNPSTGKFDDSVSRTNATSNARYGDLGTARNYAMIGDNAQTVQVVMDQQLAFMADPPRLYKWTESLNGLSYDVMDGVPATDIEGLGAAGWVKRAMLVMQQAHDTKTSEVTSIGFDVDPLMTI